MKLLLAAAAAAALLEGQTVRIGVFGLFHPTELGVRPATGESIRVESGSGIQILEGNQTKTFRLVDSSAEVRISSVSGHAADLFLIVPGKIERRFHGVAALRPGQAGFTATVEMEREVAVASIVAAEIAPGAPLEALKAQAVVARSFLAASPPRHAGFDFCDTTHCQFLRAWPPPGSDAYRATADTRGLVLTYAGSIIAPRYSAACGGHTIGSDANEAGSHGYRYRPVACDYCLRHAGEPVRGHRLGMCQQGASGMAARGAAFREILGHYYPGAAVSAR